MKLYFDLGGEGLSYADKEQLVFASNGLLMRGEQQGLYKRYDYAVYDVRRRQNIEFLDASKFLRFYLRSTQKTWAEIRVDSGNGSLVRNWRLDDLYCDYYPLLVDPGEPEIPDYTQAYGEAAYVEMDELAEYISITVVAYLRLLAIRGLIESYPGLIPTIQWLGENVPGGCSLEACPAWIIDGIVQLVRMGLCRVDNNRYIKTANAERIERYVSHSLRLSEAPGDNEAPWWSHFLDADDSYLWF